MSELNFSITGLEGDSHGFVIEDVENIYPDDGVMFVSGIPCRIDSIRCKEAEILTADNARLRELLQKVVNAGSELHRIVYNDSYNMYDNQVWWKNELKEWDDVMSEIEKVLNE